MENIRIQVVEYAPEWENTKKNLQFLSEFLKDTEESEIIILPEMFATGFSMNTEKIAEKPEGKAIRWMKEMSLKTGSALCGSLVIEENTNYYNRFVFIAEGNLVAQYDKRHLFSYGGESEFYTAGTQKVVFEYLGWKICPMICFDLRFPVWNRNVEDYDLMINVACWPDTRIEVWNTLLKARAIENMSYVCGVNRIGKDGMKLNYTGHSAIFSPIGRELELQKEKEYLYQQTISLTEIQKWRSKYKFLEERDHFKIIE